MFMNAVIFYGLFDTRRIRYKTTSNLTIRGLKPLERLREVELDRYGRIRLQDLMLFVTLPSVRKLEI